MLPGELIRTVAFGLLAAVVLVGAVWVVTLRNLFRAALSLGMVLLGVAGLFLLLEAEFLAPHRRQGLWRPGVHRHRGGLDVGARDTKLGEVGEEDAVQPGEALEEIDPGDDTTGRACDSRRPDRNDCGQEQGRSDRRPSDADAGLAAASSVPETRRTRSSS